MNFFMKKTIKLEIPFEYRDPIIQFIESTFFIYPEIN